MAAHFSSSERNPIGEAIDELDSARRTLRAISRLLGGSQHEECIELAYLLDPVLDHLERIDDLLIATPYPDPPEPPKIHPASRRH